MNDLLLSRSFHSWRLTLARCDRWPSLLFISGFLSFFGNPSLTELHHHLLFTLTFPPSSVILTSADRNTPTNSPHGSVKDNKKSVLVTQLLRRRLLWAFTWQRDCCYHRSTSFPLHKDSSLITRQAWAHCVCPCQNILKTGALTPQEGHEVTPAQICIRNAEFLIGLYFN